MHIATNVASLLCCRVSSNSPCTFVLQVIVTRGKELILSEKERRAGFGVQLSVGFSDVVSPKGLSFDEFAAEVQKTWEGMWEKVYDSNLAGGCRAWSHGYVGTPWLETS